MAGRGFAAKNADFSLQAALQRARRGPQVAGQEWAGPQRRQGEGSGPEGGIMARRARRVRRVRRGNRRRARPPRCRNRTGRPAGPAGRQGGRRRRGAQGPSRAPRAIPGRAGPGWSFRARDEGGGPARVCSAVRGVRKSGDPGRKVQNGPQGNPRRTRGEFRVARLQKTPAGGECWRDE